MRVIAKDTIDDGIEYWGIKIAYADDPTTAYTAEDGFVQDTTGSADAIIYIGNAENGGADDVALGGCSDSACSVKFDPSQVVAGWWGVEFDDVGAAGTNLQTVDFCIEFTYEATGSP